MKLATQIAVVTGAATGIGRAIAVALAAEGASVLVDYTGAGGDSEETLRRIAEIGGQAFSFKADVSNPEHVHALIDYAVECYGQLDILVNNAAIQSRQPFVDMDLDNWNRTLGVNLTGAFLCAQAAARQMITQGRGGRIINVSSVHEDMPAPQNIAYAAAKGGLRMLMRTMAVELAPHKITVNNIAPGGFPTPINADVLADPEAERKLISRIPLKRWGALHEVAAMAVFLASEEAAYCTGHTYAVDGGVSRFAGD